MTVEEIDTMAASVTGRGLTTAADGHRGDVNRLREAVAAIEDELNTWADEIADTHILEGHGDSEEPTVISESDTHLSIYVEYGTLARMADEHPEITDNGDIAPAVGWAHNEYARRHGANADALGTMHAVGLPQTAAVNEIIAEQE